MFAPVLNSAQIHAISSYVLALDLYILGHARANWKQVCLFAPLLFLVVFYACRAPPATVSLAGGTSAVDLERLVDRRIADSKSLLEKAINLEGVTANFARAIEKEQSARKASETDLKGQLLSHLDTKVASLASVQKLDELLQKVEALRAQLAQLEPLKQKLPAVEKQVGEVAARVDGAQKGSPAAAHDHPELLAKLQKEVQAQLDSLEKKIALAAEAQAKGFASKAQVEGDLAKLSQRLEDDAALRLKELEAALSAKVRELIAETAPKPAGSPTSATPAPFDISQHRDELDALVRALAAKEVATKLSELEPARVLAGQKNVVVSWISDALQPEIAKLEAKIKDSSSSKTERPAAAHDVQGAPAISDERLRKLIGDELELFAADRIGRPDFALESAGGSIVRWRTSPSYRIPSWLGLLAKPRPPNTILQPETDVGRCWAFEGDKGEVTIRLSAPVVPTAFTLEHASSRVAHNLHSAPKDVVVWGLRTEEDAAPVRLADYRYDVNATRAVQTFPSASVGEALPFVMLQVLSNYGHQDYTCVYRFRVHGDERTAPAGDASA